MDDFFRPSFCPCTRFQETKVLTDNSKFLLKSYLFSSMNSNFGSVAETWWPVLSCPIRAPGTVSLKNCVCLKEIELKITYKCKENDNTKFFWFLQWNFPLTKENSSRWRTTCFFHLCLMEKIKEIILVVDESSYPFIEI